MNCAKICCRRSLRHRLSASDTVNVVDHAACGFGDAFKTCPERLGISVPKRDVPRCSDFHVKAEVSTDDIGHGLGFQFCDGASERPAIFPVQRFVCQFVGESLGLLSGRVAIVNLDRSLFRDAEHATGNRLESDRNRSLFGNLNNQIHQNSLSGLAS